MTRRFSDRHGYRPAEAEISVRHDAPDEFRAVLVDIAYEAGMRPHTLRSHVCRVLRVAADENNWSEYPNVDGEVRGHLRECPWYRVYDILEAIYERLHGRERVSRGKEVVDAGQYFADQINDYFRERGIGWQLVDGQIEVRGSESFEQAVHGGAEALDAAGKTTAARELHEALSDLSRRPEPDVTGAIQHAMAALECVARDAVGDQKATLGQLIKRNPDLFPRPLDEALEKAWGYASEAGRHLKEGNAPAFDEAELVVGVCGSACRYIARKLGAGTAGL